MDSRRVFKTPTNNSYASDYIKNKKSKVIFSGTSNLASTIVEQGGAFPLVTPSGQLKPYQGTFGFSSATPTQGAPPSTYCLNTAHSYSDLLNITKGKYLLTPPNLTTTTITQLNDVNFSPQLFCGNLYEKGKTGVNEIIIFNSSVTGVTGATGATGAVNKIIYNTATTANQWIKVDPSYNMLHNGSSCQSDKSNVLTDVKIRPNINAQRKLDRYLNLDVQGFNFPVKFSLNYQQKDCINANNDIQTVNNELSFIPSFLTRTVGDAPFLMPSYVTFNSPVPITYSSSNPAVATVSGTTVTIQGVVGSTTITASQVASDDGIYPAGVATIRLDVTLIPLRLNEFTILPRDYGTAPFTLTPPTSNSSGAFTFSSSKPEVATVGSTTGVVTIVGAGTTIIEITQAAAGNYTSGTIRMPFTVNPIAPTLGSFSIGSKNFGTAPFALTPPTSNSLGAFSYTSGNIDIATILGSTVTIVGAGTVEIIATQAAAGNYTSKSVPANFTVNPIAPTMGSFSIAPRDFGSVPFSILPNTHTVLYIRNGGSDWKTKVVNNDISNTNLQAWAGIDKQWFDLNYGEGNEVALQFRFFAAYVTSFYNITSASSSVVSAYGNIGTYSFTFNGGTNYTGTFNGQVQSWDYTLPSDFTVNRNMLQPTSNSSGVFIYASGNTGVATISGNTVTIVGAGTAVITATQAAAGNYTAGSTTTTFIVNPIAPTLGSFSIPYRNFGTAPFTLTPPTSNSLGAFSYTSDNTSVATVLGDVVTIVGAGYSKINVTQAAAGNYTESLPLYYIFRVNKIAPNLTNFSIPAKDFGTSPFTLTPPTSTNISGAFTFTSTQEDVATISGNTVTIVGAGTTVIRATQAATTNYISKYIEASFVVRQVIPKLGNFSNVSVKFNSGAFTLEPPTSLSDGRFTYTSSDLNVATVGNTTGVVTILNVGTTTITVLQDASGNFASNTTTGTITVQPALPDLGPFEILPRSVGQAPFTLTLPSTDSSGAFTFTSSNTSVATVGSTTGLVTILAGGSTTITATQAASGNFKTDSVSAVFVVTSLRLAANNVTVQYDGINIDTMENIPLFVQYNLRNTGMEWFAIVDDRSLPEITNYALTLQSQYFTPSGQTTPVPFNNIVTTLMTNMSNMFSGASTFNSVIDSWDTSRVTNMRGMFINASAFNQNIGAWNTAKVMNMSSMFQNALLFNQNIGAWDTSKVTDMSNMFFASVRFNQPIGNWNTSAVTDMISMFQGARAFNQNIGTWDTGAVINMSNMFFGALVFNNNGNSSIGNWDTSRVRDMSWMFTAAVVFDQNIGKWNTSAVTNMRSMFQDAFIFNQPIYTNSMGNGGWNTSNVTNMSAMFISVRLFDQPIGNWNTSAVTDMSHMFNSSRIFNKNISAWTVAQVRFFDGFRANSVLSTENTPPRFR